MKGLQRSLRQTDSVVLKQDAQIVDHCAGEHIIPHVRQGGAVGCANHGEVEAATALSCFVQGDLVRELRECTLGRRRAEYGHR
jgi:hypothetical protein